MTIGYYLSGIKPSDGGIFQYSIYILKMLLKSSIIDNVYLFYSKDQSEFFSEFINHKKATPVLYDDNRRLTKLLRHLANFCLTRYYIHKVPNPLYLKFYKVLNPDGRFLNKYSIDVLHIPRQHSPAYGLKFPVIITMHDVQHIHFPEFFTPIERIHKSIKYYTSIQEADHIIVSFNHVKNDLLKYFKQSKTSISVCSVPVNDEWVSKIPESNEILRIKYKLPSTFILTPAATWEHKNHIAILEALNILRKENFKVFWVATGNKMPFYDEINKRIESLQLQDQVLFTGMVSDHDLRGLYSLSKLVVIPTLYEAGSGPLFEAMRYGVPVICSNVTSLPETIGNCKYIFDPLNYKEIAKLIKLGLTDTEFIQSNLENSKLQISMIYNKNYDESFFNVYTEAIKSFKSIK